VPIINSITKYIEGKSVAIVGPAPSNIDLSSEINSYDVVIRLNYKGKEYFKYASDSGNKINVSYYNGENSTLIKNFKNRSFLDDIDFAIFKKFKYGYQIELQKKYKKSRELKSFDSYIFMGSLNMIPNVVLDILRFNTTKIKIFKTNFFMSDFPHEKGYKLKNQAEIKTSDSWNMHWEHNLVSQIKLMKNLWRSSKIEIDHECMKVLELNIDEYIKNMEMIYT
jgi:hypothetical protein